MEQAGTTQIQKLRQRYIGYQLLADALLAAACALIMGSMVYRPLGNTAIALAVITFIIVIAILAAFRRPWATNVATICRFLDFSYPELEESSALLLKPANHLNLLESLQLSKIQQAMAHIPAQPPLFTQRLKKAAWLFGIALVLSVAIFQLSKLWHTSAALGFGSEKTGAKSSLPPEKVLPQIDGVNVRISPPAYTGKGARTQDKFTIEAEEGATVTWNISTNIAVKKIWLLFNEHEKLPLTGTNATEWKASRAINKPGFYQVSIDGKLSDLYQIQVIKDGLPVIRIKAPKQYTHIDAGEAPRVTISTTVSDDYGISNAQIYATVAKGSGESVKFKDTTFSFNNASFGGHGRQYNLQRTIDLPKLGMEPGDELYFYIQAQDTHQQKNRTDVLIVSIQDTAQLLSMDGIVAAANIKPEYFRSQRQIIIDTEKLLKDKDSISVTAFKTRSNDIGTDQKMLRLRYGKFLGDEEEGANEGDENEEVGKAENFGDAKLIMDAYTDKHDNAEDATFLEPAVKAQLKATLNEMWRAELQLRLYKPQQALPFEYKALRLLKDLQQKSRSFVAKTSYNPPPIKPEKRLSGDLTKIGQPVNQQNIKATADKFETMKKAAAILDQSRHQVLTAPEKRILQLAGTQLAAQASAQPGTYLKAVSALRRILATSAMVNAADRAIVEKAIQKTLPVSKTVPYPAAATVDMGLAQRYYKNLNR
jgi:hypothetical protein